MHPMEKLRSGAGFLMELHGYLCYNQIVIGESGLLEDN